MASPQVENGYVRIANELYDAIVSYRGLTGVDMKVVLYIIRWTYGWKGRKKFQVSYGKIASSCKADRPGVLRSIRKLSDHNIIFVQHTRGDKNSSIIGINKNYETWVNNIGWEV